MPIGHVRTTSITDVLVDIEAIMRVATTGTLAHRVHNALCPDDLVCHPDVEWSSECKMEAADAFQSAWSAWS